VEGVVAVSRLQVRHLSRYAYDHPVSASFNEARLTPAALPWQRRLEHNVAVEQATWQHSYQDYWGTEVRIFEALQTHRELIIESNSVVEVDETGLPQASAEMSWPALAAGPVREEFGEYLTQTAATAPDPDLAALGEKLAGDLSAHETALSVCSYIYNQMTYQPGSTGVNTPALEAWRARTGVCQDYAHLVVGTLRHVGLPARYVSGYLHPDPDAQIGVTAVGESHAWVEWWLGEWTGHDPTNNGAIGERHVLVGRGRDYTDVPPIRGLVAGSSGAAELEVTVEITRLA
jgi:transglutaminase-like putative cysteine protease